MKKVREEHRVAERTKEQLSALTASFTKEKAELEEKLKELAAKFNMLSGSEASMILGDVDSVRAEDAWGSVDETIKETISGFGAIVSEELESLYPAPRRRQKEIQQHWLPQ